MKSFRFSLVRNLVGVIFITFALVYLLFNLLTNSFISEEAYRELTRNSHDITLMAQSEDADALYFRGVHPGRALRADEIMEGVMNQWEQMRTLRRLMVNAEGIIINEHNEVISPNLSQLNEEIAREVVFLINHFLTERELFENAGMVRVTGADSAYYMMVLELPLINRTAYNVLLYTDITSAMMFMGSINRTLGALLAVSGFVGIFISVLMSSQVQKAIVRLCKYAEVIGYGHFKEKAGVFKYKEFTDLAQSMNTMANMLDAYENNQKKFFQNASHELRTPLMSIQGYAEGILKDVIGKDEASEIILSESEKMEALVSQLLYVSKMDNGLDTAQITSFGLNNVLYDCAWRVKMPADKSGKKLCFNFPETEAFIRTDEEKLQKAVENILTNCIRHANEVICISYEKIGAVLKIMVSDDGAGIDKDDLAHIFERFYKGVNGNSGLGLSISKDIAEKLGGSILAENIYENSQNPTGAKFTISIPINQ